MEYNVNETLIQIRNILAVGFVLVLLALVILMFFGYAMVKWFQTLTDTMRKIMTKDVAPPPSPTEMSVSTTKPMLTIEQATELAVDIARKQGLKVTDNRPKEVPPPSNVLTFAPFEKAPVVPEEEEEFLPLHQRAAQYEPTPPNASVAPNASSFLPPLHELHPKPKAQNNEPPFKPVLNQQVER